LKRPDTRKGQVKAESLKRETIRLEKPDQVCAKCDRHYLKYVGRPVVVVSCEGAGLRGEVARRAARLICEKLFPGDTARVCLGASFSYEGGPRKLLRYASQTFILDGCSIQCATRMLRAAVKGSQTDSLVTDRLFRFNKDLVEVGRMSERQLDAHARTVARKAAARMRAFLKKYRKY
jgi:uncharacterized metal-binding protein